MFRVPVLFSCLAALLCAFLFGYTTAVISGAIIFLKKDFALSSFEEGVSVSIILIGAIVGASFSGILSDKYGRVKTLFFTGVLFTLGSLATTFSSELIYFLSARFFTGIGVGISSLIVPLYLAEMATTEKRGAWVSLNQLFITVGVLVAYLVNYLFSSTGNWQWMFGFAACVSFIQCIAATQAKETSHWLLLKEEKKKEKIPFFHKLLSWSSLFKGKARMLVCIGILLSIFQQITGINTVIYYAPQIFQMTGYSSSSTAILATVGLGLINFFATLLSSWLLDRWGRRRLLLIGILGMVLSLFSLSFILFASSFDTPFFSFFILLSYVAFFAIGLGPVTWVLLSEIYPLHIRARAMSLATFANWVANYLVSLTFLDLVSWFGAGMTFSLYAFIGVFSFFFIYVFIPETKGKSLEII